MRLLSSVLCLLLLTAAPSAAAAPARSSFAGKVVSVFDGDTIGVLHGGREERIRLYGIDCPEHHQAFGGKAKQATSELSFGREVTVEVRDTDKYGRTVGWVILPGGRSLNEALVAEGYAWWYQHFAPGNKTLQRLEQQARGAKLGLWADPHPIPPWEFRRSSPR